MRRALPLVLVLMCMGPAPAAAYSVLAHEAAIDAAWEKSIAPLLMRKYPRTTRDELMRARAFAYGGSVIQDLGYYPFGSRFFSNLLHYVRAGDFVETIIADAQNVDEYAFALGALAHYVNDNTGHPEAVNKTVPILFPKLRAKYGDSVTYVEGPKQHVITEFSFDVVQAAAGAYVPDAYRQFIGFEVATDLLARAFRDTYGLTLDDVFADTGRALGTYRYSVSQIVPAITDAAWKDKQDEIERLIPGVDRQKFVFAFSRADFEQAYGRDYQRPGRFARFLGFLYRLLPKVGPLKPLAFKAPTADAERLFAASFRDANVRYQAAIRDAADGRFTLRNTNFDTGTAIRAGDYSLADDTYAELLKRWRKRHFEGMPEALTANILTFYRVERSSSSSSTAAIQDKGARKALQALLTSH